VQHGRLEPADPPVTHPDSSPVLADRDCPLLTLVLNRPDRLDAVSLALYERLISHLEEADADPSVRCVIVTGKGRAFCAGADLKAYRDRRPPLRVSTTVP